MISKQLLSIVFSLIMFTGVTAGSAAFAESDEYDKDMRDKLDRYCEMSDQEKRDFISEHEKAEDHVAKMNEYCELDEVQRDAYIKEHKDEYKMHTDKDMRHSLEKYCEMSDDDRAAYITEHNKDADKAAKMDRYCTLDEDGRTDFIAEHLDEYRAYMKDKMTDKKPHMDYDRLCSMAESDRASEITDVAKLDRISEWCNMTPEEREDYKRDHPDKTRDMKMDKKHDFDRMSDVTKDKLHDKAMKFSDESKRLKAMIMDKRDISDDRMDEIKMKYREKHGDLTDERKSDLKQRFDDYMRTIKVNISDERKTAIQDRVAEMKAFKIDLRERSSELSDEEKQELRAEFIEKAKDLQLAWITPRHQMHAGIDAADIECREGFSHVMKLSNGKAMCLKADSALKMIDRGIAVPAN